MQLLLQYKGAGFSASAASVDSTGRIWPTSGGSRADCVTFAKGAALKDPARLFNSSLEGNTRRAIDYHEGDKIDEKSLKSLILAAV
ncbi:MAG: DUF1801 domain-containing protein, partial [Pirellulales bacterium]|nr:DUF1801 domain-containing protein [Pirellulales bacterium]